MPLSTTQYGFIIDPMVPFTDASGTTIRNGYVRVFVAGSSTPVITYKNYDGATNEETIQLDNSGRTAYPVIVSKGNTYKVCVYDAEHSQESPIFTIDKVVPAGANVEATNIVTGLDNVESPEAGWVKSTVSGTDAEVSLDATNVTSEVDTLAKATAASADYMMPLVHKTGSDSDKKITLGNILKFVLDNIVNLATTITSFASGDYFVVGRSTGAVKMSKDSLLTKTAQNALGKIVTEFVENSTTTKAGFLYAYGGNTYKALEAYYGAWDATKFSVISIGNEAIKMLGNATDIGLTDADNAPIGSIIFCSSVLNAPTTSINLLTFGRSSNREYKEQIAFKVNSTDMYIRGNNSDGSAWTSWKKVLTEDDYNKVLDIITLCCKVVPLNLNDTSIWEVGGISSSSGGNETNASRLRTKFYYEIFPTTSYAIAYQNGMTCPSGFSMYCYAADGSFLGRVSTNNSQPIAAFTQYPTTKYIRFGFNNLVGGQTISAANLANIAVFSGNLGVYKGEVELEDLKGIGCYKFNSALTLNTTYAPAVPKIHDNFILQVEVSGDIDNLDVGMGYLKTQGLWLEVTPTKVYVKGGTGATQKAEYTHGLTLGTSTIIKIWRNNYEDVINFSISTEKMDVYENTYTPTGQFAGQVFVRNVAATDKSLSVVGAYSIKRISANVWIVGDSYCGCHTDNCWPYHMIQLGVKSFFIEEENGMGASDAWTDFTRFANINSTPKLLVWAIGMNNSTDSGGNPPSTWVTVTNWVVDWCHRKQVKLALVTIPTVPGKDNSAKDSYLRSLASDNIIIVDAAAAVEQEGTNTWKYYGTSNAFLSGDSLHPSAFGAKAILTEVLKKLPEIAVE